jgi:Glycosyltransferases, probably involved in cell wall biogenesis
MKEKIIIIIPCFNEEETILTTVNAIKDKYDYIVINDGSTDNSKEVLKRNNINHVNLVMNLGIGGAMETGYKYAYQNNCDIALQFDGDYQHDETYIKNLIEPILKKEANLVIGTRYIKGKKSKFQSTFLRRLGKNIISFCILILTGKKITDPTSGFRASDKLIIEYFKDHYVTEYPEPETNLMLLKKKYKVLEVPVEMKERIHGTSSIKPLKSIYYMISVILALFLSKSRRSK